MRVIDTEARMACLAERREVIDAMWEAMPFHLIRWVRLEVRAWRLERKYAIIMQGVEDGTP